MGYKRISPVSSQNSLTTLCPAPRRGRKPKAAPASKPVATKPAAKRQPATKKSVSSFNTTVLCADVEPPKRRGRKPTARSLASVPTPSPAIGPNSTFATPRKRKLSNDWLLPRENDENQPPRTKLARPNTNSSGDDGSPIARPWNAQVQSAKTRTGKRLPRLFETPTQQRTLRRSARLSALRAGSGDNTIVGNNNGSNSNHAPMSKTEAEIQARMQELRDVDYTELKRQLGERGKVKVTPPVNQGRPTYNLQNLHSINRKFIDDEAERCLDEHLEPGQSEFRQRPGAAYLVRSICDEDDECTSATSAANASADQ